MLLKNQELRRFESLFPFAKVPFFVSRSQFEFVGLTDYAGHAPVPRPSTCRRAAVCGSVPSKRSGSGRRAHGGGGGKRAGEGQLLGKGNGVLFWGETHVSLLGVLGFWRGFPFKVKHKCSFSLWEPRFPFQEPGFRESPCQNGGRVTDFPPQTDLNKGALEKTGGPLLTPGVNNWEARLQEPQSGLDGCL